MVFISHQSVPKMMVQFCHARLYLGTETVFCRGLLLLMARMDMAGLKIEKIGPSFSSLKASPKRIFLVSAPC